MHNALSITIPVFLVFGIHSNTTANAIHMIPALPNLVIKHMTASPTGVRIFCIQSKIINSTLFLII